MSVGPRVVFVRFASSESPKLVPWQTHAASIVGRANARPQLQDDLVVWQLVSGNNRELARSAAVYLSFDEARSSAVDIAAEPDRLVFGLANEAERGLYGWYASRGAQAAITCARWYASDRDRNHSMKLAAASLAVASIHDGARLAHPELMAGDRGPRL